MASTLRTPGVYVEEISKFPPSVAQVETAIPAFIGYTEKAEKDNEILVGEPTRITSLLEYVTYFGEAEKETGFTATVNEDGDGNKTIVTNSDTVTTSKFLMYYAMQMYFANGGGPCWIVSVGLYNPAGPDFAELDGGLTKLEKEDEPTLIIFPDAKSLSSDSHFYSLYNNALTQCKNLQDRFTIIDTYSNVADVEMNDPEGVRNRISSDAEEKKYGAAYFPYLKTILNFNIDESTVSITHTVGDAAAIIKQSKDKITNFLAKITSTNTDTATFKGNLVTAISAITSLSGTAAVKYTNSLPLIPTVITAIDGVIGHIQNVIVDAEAVVSTARLVANAGVTPAPVLSDALILDEKITVKLRAVILAFEGFKDDYYAASNMAEVTAAGTATLTAMASFFDPTVPNNIIKTEIIDVINLPNLLAKVNALVPLGGGASGALNGTNLAGIKNTDTEIYNAIKKELEKVTVVLPPSSSMAGVYARVDSSRGVWKAPANVSLKYVIKPTQKITHELNGRLNIDTSGKTINAIRSFTGKGTIVWGARTLAGNDNEWRYISVRRFFNMVEESVKKASDQFVFEANDANTWVKIRAMIENFLTNQWRAGALAGAKADDAFYVRIGLNQTMTAQDILNGIMNIEIGMAVVRPAEFIVLKFSHKMQES